ncbi:MAG: N-acetylmuramoyl-L-alanine amidase [Candidatus Bipolaricaulota bacterium]|nr:N-acetylmuramoyl-L-alanine amidase [Candidatus Bipolaricaulota bacterium]MCS7275093.1 N-acetylmuramoyl-L-alanine amidase [Candidatus Bipolaricaulota bacterium]MDW8110421.1 N-acetylmuramoyl-L-alanine amidase [Candidatus Bipolaricaulota bacterium]MDW8329727.1 N-acetylmuramoyl-L-alanine amidase [Candidatus Bipolaricaulota bacterium]
MRALSVGLLITALYGLGASPQALSYRVIIDPGHGGDDTGAIGLYEIIEKQIVLQIAHLVAIQAVAFPHLRVILTRVEDRYVSREERLKIAQAGDLFISLHTDFSHDARVRGVRAQIATSAGVSSEQLAELLLQRVTQATKASSLGVERAPLWLRRMKIPAVQFYLGFVTNPEEARKLSQMAYQTALAQAILEAIDLFLKSQPKNSR